MNEIHEIWMKYPFYGYRRITQELRKIEYIINHKRVYRLLRLMNLKAIYPKPNTSKRNQAHSTWPYLLKGMTIDHPNQVWMTDITYIPLSTGFVYLVAIIDVYSRYLLAWELSNSLEVDFCLTMLDKGLQKNKPLIMNSDQGCQFTSLDWCERLQKEEIQISMDGKGRCLDNVYIERFWRSLKQEEIYLKPPETMAEARQGIEHYITFYNHERPHQSLNYQTPEEVYHGLARVLPEKIHL